MLFVPQPSTADVERLILRARMSAPSDSVTVGIGSSSVPAATIGAYSRYSSVPSIAAAGATAGTAPLYDTNLRPSALAEYRRTRSPPPHQTHSPLDSGAESYGVRGSGYLGPAGAFEATLRTGSPTRPAASVPPAPSVTSRVLSGMPSYSAASASAAGAATARRPVAGASSRYTGSSYGASSGLAGGAAGGVRRDVDFIPPSETLRQVKQHVDSVLTQKYGSRVPPRRSYSDLDLHDLDG